MKLTPKLVIKMSFFDKINVVVIVNAFKQVSQTETLKYL